MKGKVMAILATLMVLVFAVSVMVSCTAKRTPTEVIPTNTPITPTRTATPTQQPATPTMTATAVPAGYYYSFDSSAEGWTMNADQMQAPSQSAGSSFAGAGKLQAACNFTDGTGGLVYKDLTSAPLDITGKWIYARVWVPADYPQYGGAMLYVKSGAGNTWNQGVDVTVIPGQWNEIHFNGSSAATPSDIRELGIKFRPSGSFASTYTSNVYADEIVISSTAFSETGTLDFTSNQTAIWCYNVEGADSVAYSGKTWSSGTMVVPAAFTSTVMTGIMIRRPEGTLNLNNASLSITMDVGSLYNVDPSTPYGIQIYLKTGAGWTWNDGGYWTNLDQAGMKTYTRSGVTATDVREIGFKVTKGGYPGPAWSADWSGNITIDAITITNN